MAGSNIELSWLRQRYPASSRGSNLQDLIKIADSIGLASRAVRCEPEELSDLRRPSILHWGMSHFVVLDKIKGHGIRIFDPLTGYRVVSTKEIHARFTGVALELSVTPQFERRRERAPFAISGILRWTPEIRSGLVQACILSILLQVYVVVSPFYMQVSIDQAASAGDRHLMLGLAIGFGALAMFNAGADAIRGVALQRVSALLNWDMTQRLFHHMIRLPLPWFQRRRLADSMSRFQAIDPIRNLISNGLVGSVIDGTLSLSTMIFMFIFSPQLSIFAIIGVFITSILRVIMIPHMMGLSADALLASVAEQGKRLETIRAIQTIKGMAGEVQREGDWGNKFAEVIRTTQASALFNLGLGASQGVVESLTQIVIVYFSVISIIDNKMTVGVLYAFLAYRVQFSQRAANVFSQFVNWRMLELYAFRLSDIVLSPIEHGFETGRTGLLNLQGGIVLKSVFFRYGPEDPFVLKNIDLRISAGKFTAIVGSSGSGKSTLLKVICGLYPPTAGEIEFDNLPISTWGEQILRSHTGLVLQDDELLPGTIAENVAFFGEEIDLDWVWECLKICSIDEEIRMLPMRADTFVGDVGGTLSGGQRQRILLARALYKRPKVLILDEATAHLDLRRESIINASLLALNITRIVVTHRPQTIEGADSVYNLEAGRLRPIR